MTTESGIKPLLGVNFYRYYFERFPESGHLLKLHFDVWKIGKMILRNKHIWHLYMAFVIFT